MNVSDAVLADITLQGIREYLPSTGSELTGHLEWLTRETRPVLAIDVGSMTGSSVIAIARNLRTGCCVIGIEAADDLARRAAANIQLAGLSDRATVIRGDATDVLPTFSGPVDLVYFDASRARYGDWLRRLEPKLAPGAVIVANLGGAGAAATSAYLRLVREGKRYDSAGRMFDGVAVEVSRFLG